MCSSDAEKESLEMKIAELTAKLQQPPRSKTAVLIFCYNRAEYLQRMLDTLLKCAFFSLRLLSIDPCRYAPEYYPIIISQDGSDESVANLVRTRYANRTFFIQVRLQRFEHTP